MSIAITKGSTYRVEHYPKCSTKCLETCPPCVVKATGKYTGRSWHNESLQTTYYEVKYRKDGQKETYSGIFTSEELTLLKEKPIRVKKSS